MVIPGHPRYLETSMSSLRQRQCNNNTGVDTSLISATSTSMCNTRAAHWVFCFARVSMVEHGCAQWLLMQVSYPALRAMPWQHAAQHGGLGDATLYRDALHWSQARQGSFSKSERRTVAADMVQEARKRGGCGHIHLCCDMSSICASCASSYSAKS
jgi:hypothetical protein